MRPGYWILDTGYWILDTGYWILDTGFWTLDTGYWILAWVYWPWHGYTGPGMGIVALAVIGWALAILTCLLGSTPLPHPGYTASRPPTPEHCTYTALRPEVNA